MAAVLVLTACSGTGVHQAGEAAPSSEQAGRPTQERTQGPRSDPTQEPGPAGRPVAEWLREGGYMAPGLVAARPPMLVVYADGRVIADAALELRLPADEVDALVEALKRDLAGQPAIASPKPGTPRVIDAPTTVLGVETGGGMREVRVPYLEHGEASYDAALVDARDRLARLAERVAAQGRDYSTDRVRLFAEQLTASPTDAKPWPEGVPLPPETQLRLGRKDYKGTKAFTIARLVPRVGSWHVYRTSSGKEIALWWRWLLPHE